MMDVDEAVTIMSAVRYALGRSSYAPVCVMDHLRKIKDRISEEDRSVLWRDIGQHLNEHPNDTYAKEWREFAKEMYA